MEIVSAEIAANNAGVMADVAMTEAVSHGQYGGLAKTISYDTTFTNKTIYNGSLTGQHSPVDPQQEISLNKSALLVVTGIISGVVTINGTATNNSSYEFSAEKQI